MGIKNNSYILLMRAFRLLKKRKTPIIAKDLGGNGKSYRQPLEILCKLGVAEKVDVVYKTGKNYNIAKDVPGYILKKHKEVKK